MNRFIMLHEVLDQDHYYQLMVNINHIRTLIPSTKPNVGAVLFVNGERKPLEVHESIEDISKLLGVRTHKKP